MPAILKTIDVPVLLIPHEKSIVILYSLSNTSAASRRTAAGMTVDLFEQHQGTHILQVNTATLLTTPKLDQKSTISSNEYERFFHLSSHLMDSLWHLQPMAAFCIYPKQFRFIWDFHR